MKILVPVVGMHRSGTSCAAGCLQIAGVDFGPEELLMPPSPDNPKGYFESLPVVKIHDRLLRAFGGRWDRPVVPNNFACHASWTAAVRHVKQHLDAFEGPGPHGVKDPRMSLFYDAWERAASSAGVDLRPVVVYRNGGAVCRSLAARDGMSSPEAYALQARYQLGASTWYARPERAAILYYEDLLRDPVEELLRVMEELDLDPRLAQELDHDAVDAFVDGELNRHG